MTRRWQTRERFFFVVEMCVSYGKRGTQKKGERATTGRPKWQLMKWKSERMSCWYFYFTHHNPKQPQQTDRRRLRPVPLPRVQYKFFADILQTKAPNLQLHTCLRRVYKYTVRNRYKNTVAHI